MDREAVRSKAPHSTLNEDRTETPCQRFGEPTSLQMLGKESVYPRDSGSVVTPKEQRSVSGGALALSLPRKPHTQTMSRAQAFSPR